MVTGVESHRRDSLNFFQKNLKLNLVINDIILIDSFPHKYLDAMQAQKRKVKGNLKGI